MASLPKFLLLVLQNEGSRAPLEAVSPQSIPLAASEFTFVLSCKFKMILGENYSFDKV